MEQGAEDFQTRMLKYIKYGLSIQTKQVDGEEYYLVGINFKPSWEVLTPAEESNVNCLPSTENKGGAYYYFSKIENGINPIFSSIEETIEYNEDIEKKVELLKIKVAELQEIFATEPYWRLQGLRFEFTPIVDGGAKPKSKKKKKQAKNTKVQQEEAKKIEETTAAHLAQNDTETKEEETKTEENNEVVGNKEEATEIDAKIAQVIGK